MKKRICIIGLEREPSLAIRKNYFGPTMYHEMLPKFLVNDGRLFIERTNGIGMLPVDIVVFHGIFENDLDLLTGLAIWGGPCFPNALAMMNCRLKLPCLARALQVSRFNTRRGFLPAQGTIQVNRTSVAKWGNWHCGENKQKFSGEWTGRETSVIEPFFPGESVRVVALGGHQFQIRLAGESWLKSIDDESAAMMEMDPELLEDTLRIKKAFGMDLIANDYIIDNEGNKHLLEVNHIPNMVRFKQLQDSYIQVVNSWIHSQL
ncbi:ATP-grasp domain-containing protein [Flavilitoribacter nigricans]|uniref:ATP-grasp fold RimK-type domain-containing protein n=1 Tax=Flavilitoribacter nigricans (strain ATCC 23147 / DSM 23189 / NBRC 102662 / NCIMB 1420 / SS-2) TaxID=1122177 RepID=A0A2D0NIB9_FLAN2|nr:hypothetical protein [Flavilitoribacter nigricans]PHN08242.1 hypothetical protein CRP01_02660 [Flavilitoribacter nigricans DSM 23189 = NBRC 102662]